MDWLTALTSIQRWGLEYVFKRYYGLYEANVTDVRDPEKRGRVRAICPAIGAREPSREWFRPAFAQAGANRGLFLPPSLGDSVWVSFTNGDPSRPHVYLGGWFGNPDGVPEVPTELGYDAASPPNPRRFGFLSRLGLGFVFNETPGEEAVELRWHQPAPGDPALTDASKTADRSGGKTSHLRFKADGSAVLTNALGAVVELDAATPKVVVRDTQGNTITLDQDGVKVESSGAVVVQAQRVDLKAAEVTVGDAASYKAVLGQPLLDYLRDHKHGTGSGPSSEPLVPPSQDLLSSSVTVKD